MDTRTWLKNTIGTDSYRAASHKVGYAQTTLQRQIDKGKLSPEMVIALCRAYHRSPITGLIENGYLHDYETAGVGIPYALQSATNGQLLAELTRRTNPNTYTFHETHTTDS